MLLATVIILGGVLIFYFEGYPLVKKKQKKELAIFTLILLMGVFFYIGIIFQLPIPNPLNLIAKVLMPIYKPIIAWIK